jgi:intracellular septation protein
MKFLADFFPVILFFAAYQYAGMLTATGVFMAASAIQVLYNYFRYKKVEKMHLITLVLVMFFGGLTLILRDPIFFMWKPTIVNWLFAIAFLGSEYFAKRSLLQRMMDHAITLPDQIWTQLNYAWVTFFTAMGALNLYVAYNYEEATWVSFKLFGLLGLTLVFVIGQGFVLAKYMEPEEAKEE